MSEPNDLGFNALQRILDHGKFVWIVFGTMTDFHGARVIRVCTTQESAEQFTQAVRAADPIYTVNYVKVPLDAPCKAELRA